MVTVDNKTVNLFFLCFGTVGDLYKKITPEV